MSERPLAIDLYCGLGGWTEGLLAEGYSVVGFDVEERIYGEHRYPAHLVIQDVLTLHGVQFRNAAIIVASPPCQEFSYMAMPWTRAKQIARALRGEGAFPNGYTGSRTIGELTALFDACFRIQREACEASGRFIPLVVENVCGAQKWVGPAKWHYGSYYLWGDVPALTPMTLPKAKAKVGGDWNKFNATGEVSRFNAESERATKNTGGSWFAVAHNTTSGVGQNPDGRKTKGHVNIRDGHSHTRHLTNQAESDGVKQGGDWFSDGISLTTGSKSTARKAASARIAKIPAALARHIASVYKPEHQEVA